MGYYFHFNPHSREGSDNAEQKGLLHQKYFNPRSREGSDAAARQ